jgi:hypothetical protein
MAIAERRSYTLCPLCVMGPTAITNTDPAPASTSSSEKGLILRSPRRKIVDGLYIINFIKISDWLSYENTLICFSLLRKKANVIFNLK